MIKPVVFYSLNVLEGALLSFSRIMAAGSAGILSSACFSSNMMSLSYRYKITIKTINS